MKRVFRGCAVMILTLFIAASGAHAQQAIFNMPNADALERGKVYVELDAAFKLDNGRSVRRFSSFVPRIVVGAGGNVEVGLNITGNVQPGADSTTLVPNVKWRFYENEKKDIVLYAGTHLYFPLRNKAYNLGNYTYLAVARTFNEKTRLTAGGFHFTKNVVAAQANRAGAQLGFEHTLNPKTTLAADWYSGRHSMGYLTPGVIYKPHPRVTTYWSYSIGNGDVSNGNHFFLFELGYNLN